MTMIYMCNTVSLYTVYLLLLKWTFPSSATTGNFTSSFEMEMSQAGFSAHTSKVSQFEILFICLSCTTTVVTSKKKIIFQQLYSNYIKSTLNSPKIMNLLFSKESLNPIIYFRWIHKYHIWDVKVTEIVLNHVFNVCRRLVYKEMLI